MAFHAGAFFSCMDRVYFTPISRGHAHGHRRFFCCPRRPTLRTYFYCTYTRVCHRLRPCLGLGHQGLGLRRLITPAYLERIKQNYARWGIWILIVNRFIPGLRGAFMLSAGLIKMPLKPILIWGTLSSVIWNSALLGLGYVFSDSLENLLQIFEAYGKSVLILIGLIVIGVFLFRKGRLRSCNRLKDQNQSSEPENHPEHP